MAKDWDSLRDTELWREQGLYKANAQREAISALKIDSALVISDWHVPYHDTKAIRWALNTHGDQQTLIVLGDIVNQASASRFVESHVVSLTKEVDILEKFSDAIFPEFKQVILVIGNHDDRIIKHCLRVAGSEKKEYLERINGGELDPLNYIAKRHKNCLVAHRWCRIGDAYFSHLDHYSTVPMQSAKGVYHAFHNLSVQEGVAPKVVVEAHTHHWGQMFYGNALLIENGACCNYIDYAMVGKNGPSTKNVWHQGCATLKWKSGIAQVGKCQAHFHGFAQWKD